MALDAVCRHCRLEEEDLLHLTVNSYAYLMLHIVPTLNRICICIYLLSCCPAFYSICESTVRSLKDIVISHYISTWSIDI